MSPSFISKNVFLISSFFLLILQGCSVPADYICAAGTSVKDVSGNYERGHIVGKEYELIQDVYLTQFKDGEDLTLTDKVIRATTWKDNQRKEINPYIKKDSVFKGTKFRVCSVLVKTQFGSELCSQTILANIIDDNGNILPQTNYNGKIMLINVSYLFKDTSMMADENWTFTPCDHLIKEITNSNK